MNLRQAQKSMALTWSGTLLTRGGAEEAASTTTRTGTVPRSTSLRTIWG